MQIWQHGLCGGSEGPGHCRREEIRVAELGEWERASDWPFGSVVGFPHPTGKI